MLLIFIDVLERMLAWLRPFARQNTVPSQNISDVSSVGANNSAFNLSAQMPDDGGMMRAPSDDDVVNIFNSLKKQYPLKSAPSRKKCGVENKITKKMLIKPCVQDSRVWNKIDDQYGDYVTVINLENPQ